MMERYRNLNNLDRCIRLLLSAVLIYLGFISPEIINDEVINLSIGIYGIINLISTAVGICPFYMMAGVSTYKKAPQKNH